MNDQAKGHKPKKTEASQEITEDQKLREQLAKDIDEDKFLDNPEEFSEMTLNPHEFLCLVANSYDRQSVLRHMYQPNYDFDKQILQSYEINPN